MLLIVCDVLLTMRSGELLEFRFDTKFLSTVWEYILPVAASLYSAAVYSRNSPASILARIWAWISSTKPKRLSLFNMRRELAKADTKLEDFRLPSSCADTSNMLCCVSIKQPGFLGSGEAFKLSKRCLYRRRSLRKISSSFNEIQSVQFDFRRVSRCLWAEHSAPPVVLTAARTPSLNKNFPKSETSCWLMKDSNWKLVLLLLLVYCCNNICVIWLDIFLSKFNPPSSSLLGKSSLSRRRKMDDSPALPTSLPSCKYSPGKIMVGNCWS